MIKKRIIGSIVLKNNLVVRGVNFKSYYPLGKIKYIVEALNRWGVDEIAIIDITASKNNKINYELISEASSLSNVPILYSGGISSINNIKKVLKNGADKIMLNNISHKNINQINKFANYFGRQCVVLSVDVINKKNKYFLYNYLKSDIFKNINFKEYIDYIFKLPIGEIFFNSVNNSGTFNGLDLGFLNMLPKKSSVPIIVGGGIGKPIHFIEAFSNPNINAVSIGNGINYYEHSIVLIKSFLKQKKNNIRLDTEYNYFKHSFDNEGLLKKLDQKILNKLIFKSYKDNTL